MIVMTRSLHCSNKSEVKCGNSSDQGDEMITRFILSKQAFNCNIIYDHSTLVYELTCILCMCYAMYKAVLVSEMSSKYTKKKLRKTMHIFFPLSLHNMWTENIKRRKLSHFPKTIHWHFKRLCAREICLKVRHRDNMNNITQKPHWSHRILFIHTLQWFKHELK